MSHFKRPHVLLLAALHSFAIWVSLFLGLGSHFSVQADNVDISLELASDSFQLFQIQSDGTPVQRELTLSGYVVENGVTRLRYLTEPLQISDGASVILQNLTTGGSGTLDLYFLSSTLFTSGAGLDGGTGVMMNFAIPESRYGHVFAALLNYQYYLVTPTGLVGTVDGNNQWQSLGFFNGRAYTNLGGFNWGDFKLIDVTAQESAPINAANTVDAVWQPDSTIPIASITIALPDSNIYTLHTSSGSLQSLSPTWEPTDNYWQATAQVAWAESFWISRDIDAAQSSSFTSPFDAFADTRTSIQPYVLRNLVNHTFEIGEDRAWHQLSIVHGDGYTTGLTGNSIYQNYLTYWDDNGNQVNYYYYQFIGAVDDYQSSWYLYDETTGENLGQTYQVFTAYQPQHLNPPGTLALELPASRSGHTLRLVQPNGEVWNVQAPQQWLSRWNYSHYGNPMERWYEINSYTTYAPVSGGYFARIQDISTGEFTQEFNPSDFSSLDLSQWYLPKVPINLRVSASRWFNTLILVQPNIQTDVTDKGSLQGSYTATANGLSFTSFGFFAPSFDHHSDAPWWLWDATRQEYLISDPGSPTDFLGSYDATDTDGDHIPDWWERTKGTSHTSSDTDSDGFSDYDEYMAGKDPFKKDNPNVQLYVTGFAFP